MARVDLARRAEIGREKRARTRTQIVDAATMLMSERPPEALTVDAVVDAAGVAKGTFYYHFQNLDDLAAAVGARLAQSFDELLTVARTEIADPVARISSGFDRFLDKAATDPLWARLVVRSAQIPSGSGTTAPANLKADLADAIEQGRISVSDPELAADIVIGIWLQVTRGLLDRGASPDLKRQARDAMLRALGAAP